MVLIDAGDVGISISPHPQIVFRPSLFAMSKIGEPEEIVELATRMFSGEGEIDDALRVLWACTEEDASHYTGHSGWFFYDGAMQRYTPGLMPLQDVYVIATHLLVHGIIGKTDHKPAKNDSSTNTKFVAAQYVALAIAHLGSSEAAAWQMSMTTLVNALHSKFPDIGKPKSNAPSVEEFDAAEKWIAEVNKLRG